MGRPPTHGCVQVGHHIDAGRDGEFVAADAPHRAIAGYTLDSVGKLGEHAVADHV